MISNSFIKQSLMLNLFFLRLLKEHAIFLSAGFISKNHEYMQEALRYHDEFSSLLSKNLELSKGVISINNDAVTEFTLSAEKKVASLTGIPIDTSITTQELSLKNQSLNRINDEVLQNDVKNLNNKIINSTKALIRYKTRLYDDIMNCKIQFNNYATFVKHNRIEAIFYVDILSNYQNNNLNYLDDLIQNELFWNHIMEEHSEFIRGLLDPMEKELIKTANEFAIKYDKLNKLIYSKVSTQGTTKIATKDSLSLTKEINEFKEGATKGLLNCEIIAIINPLISDHVLRESNHYIRLLEEKQKH